MPKKLDLTGQRFGRLVVLELSEKLSSGYRNYWTCKCDCGNVKDIYVSNLKGGRTNSCGCLNKELIKLRSPRKTHGMTKTKEYGCWRAMRRRIDEDMPKHCSGYEGYKALGISADQDILKSFEKFLNEIGPIPEGMKDPTIERVDTRRGYVKGNLKWLEREFQPRNRVKMNRNTSGTTGVRLDKYYTKKGSERSRYIAFWNDYNPNKEGRGDSRSKSFSIDKLGEELALFMAQEYREQMIALQNLKGAGYGDSHGKDSFSKTYYDQ